MPLSGPLIGHRGMVLRMGAARLASAFPYEIIREICVFRVSGRLRQFYQRELDLLVAGRREGGRLFYIENVVDQIGVVGHEAQEPVLPRRVAVGDRGLDQVAGAVELVLRAVGEPAFGVYMPEIRVEVAVGHAVLLYEVHGVVDDLLELGAALLGRQVSDGLHPLRHVGVKEDVRLVGVALLPAEREGVEAPRLGEPPVDVHHRDVPDKELLFLPETSVDVDIPVRYLFHRS